MNMLFDLALCPDFDLWFWKIRVGLRQAVWKAGCGLWRPCLCRCDLDNCYPIQQTQTVWKKVKGRKKVSRWQKGSPFFSFPFLPSRPVTGSTDDDDDDDDDIDIDNRNDNSNSNKRW